MDTNKLVTAYENLQADEREPFRSMYEDVTRSPDGFFLQAVMNPNIIAMSKTGSSKSVYKRLGYKQFFEAPISDLALFSSILEPGEYTKAHPLKFMTDGSFGVEERGWDKSDALRIRQRFEGRDGLHVIFFKPHPYKKAYRIEFGWEAFGDSRNLQTLLTVIRDATQHYTIVEPVPQLYADRLAKQVSAISRMYGSINASAFPNLLFQTRT